MRTISGTALGTRQRFPKCITLGFNSPASTSVSCHFSHSQLSVQAADMASHKTEHEPSMTRLSHATWGSSLLQRLHSMQQVNEQCDVLFMNTVESSVSIGAHSVVLNAASPKLRSELRECGPRLLVDGASVAAIMTMVDFIYLGSVEVADSELPAVQALAEHFEIMGLVEACCKASVERYDEAIQAGDADGEETTSTIKEEEVDDDDDDDDGSPDGMIIDVNADGQRDKGTMGSEYQVVYCRPQRHDARNNHMLQTSNWGQ